MDPIVSIIVPVYNAEETLRRCIESVLNQGFTDFELLLVDDGSTDSSAGICREYENGDRRVRVIHKENTGVSDTRNLGLSEARGTFVQFLDSDDWITPDATSLMVRAARDSGADMVIADFYYGVLWNKLFKREIIAQHGLSMDKTISWCEDFMFNLEYLRHVKTVYALRVPVYYYVKTKGSLVSQGLSLTKTIKMKRMVFEYYHDFYKSVLTEEDYEKNRLYVYRFLLAAAGDGAVPLSIFPGAVRLGDERSSVNHDALRGDGALLDAYRDRKLLDHYVEPVAIRYSLTLPEISLLVYLSQKPRVDTLKELADITGMSRARLALALQKLSMKEFIQTGEQADVVLLAAAEPVLAELGTARKDYEMAKYAGFSEEEMIQYAFLSNRIKENICRVLKKEDMQVTARKKKKSKVPRV